TVTQAINLAFGPPWVPTLGIGCNPDVPCMALTNPFGGVLVGPSNSGSGASKTNTLPRLAQFSIGLGHSITPTWGFEVSYVGNQGRHNLLRLDLNQPRPGPGSIVSRLPNPNFSTLLTPLTGGTSNYNSLQVTTKKNYDHVGLVFLASYTYSHALGTGPS